MDSCIKTLIPVNLSDLTYIQHAASAEVKENPSEDKGSPLKMTKMYCEGMQIYEVKYILNAFNCIRANLLYGSHV